MQHSAVVKPIRVAADAMLSESAAKLTPHSKRIDARGNSLEKQDGNREFRLLIEDFGAPDDFLDA